MRARPWSARFRVFSSSASMRGNICRARLRPIRSSDWRIVSRAISPCCSKSREAWRRPSSRHAQRARLVAKATAREQSHVEALDAWAAGDLDRTLAIWEAILADYPTDTLALRLAHLKYFWLGRPRDMLASVERVVPQWDRDLPGWGAILS